MKKTSNLKNYKDKRTQVLTLKLTKGEYARLLAEGMQRGKGYSEIIREYLQPVIMPISASANFADASSAVARLGWMFCQAQNEYAKYKADRGIVIDLDAKDESLI